MKHSQKGFISIGLIIAIIALLGVAGGATYAIKHKANTSAKIETAQESQIKGTDQATGDTTSNREVGNTTANTSEAGIAIDESGVHATSSTEAGIAIDESGVHIASTATVAGMSSGGNGQLSGSQSDGWFYIPELHAKFKNVSGFTPQYEQFKIESAPWPPVEGIEFSSKEIVARTQIDQKIASCTSVGRVTLSTIAKAQVPEGDYKAFHEVLLGDGRYLRIDGAQAPCYENGTSKESLDVLSAQGKLFAQFIDSAQAY